MAKRDSKSQREASEQEDMAIPLAQETDLDQQLIEAVQAGDGQSLADLIARNERWVRGVVYSALGDPNVLDDVMQKVWMTVWQRAGTLEDPRRWRYWLYRMARNAAIDLGRKKKRRRNLWQRLSHEMLGRGQTVGASDEPDPRRSASVKEQHQRVLNAIEGMPSLYREPFVLRHLEGWSYKRIAETLDLPVDTVGTRLVRARRLLQDALGEEDR